MTRTAFLRVKGGLASRLRATLGAIAYSEATGRELHIHWPLEEASETLGTFEARLSDMWEHPYTETANAKGSFPPAELGYLREQADAPGEVRFRTCHVKPFLHYFKWPIGNYMDRLEPTAWLQTTIRETQGQFTRPTIGVNIRHAIRSPHTADPDWFLSRVRDLLYIRPNAGIFLSADNEQISRQFHEVFPQTAEVPKDYVYNRAGIMRAAADLYLLARTDWMVGSNHSSFSQLAAFMRGAEYVSPHYEPGGLRGGDYEDMWNEPDEAALQKALGA